MAASWMVWAPEVGRVSSIAAQRKVGADEAVVAFLSALRAKSPSTADHSERVARYAAALTLALDLPYSQVRHLERCALLHDMGKIGIDEAILDKPGALTDAEWQAIKTHPELGAEILRSCSALESVLPAVALHHERYDGKGYPYGIAGGDLPLEARIISVCDAYDSMTADRPYRRGVESTEAARRLEQGAGTQFDPALVDIFVNQVLPALSDGIVKAS
ncbi:MAG TPA: HD-GYP domain-containing protein [Symbiobacteriaceae bacterium]|nr:HD-GYP domain-containing protein [Symbiobacteriaceae bacterium]